MMGRFAVIVVLITTLVCSEGFAQLRAVARPAGAPNAGGSIVNLPYNVSDQQGNLWMFHQYGQFQQQGNMPIYGQGAMLQINGQYPQARNNQAKIDPKTGEIVFENMPIAGLTLTRRILLNKEEGSVRYVDIIRNPQNQDVTANLTFTTSVNYGVQNGNLLADPKRKDQNLAWVALTHANNRVVVEMYGGKGAKTVPNLIYQQGNNSMQATMSPKIPANREIALMHFHYTTTSTDAGSRFVTQMRESRILASIPAAIRKLIINFRGGENFIGDYEILRGDILDVVELRTGDQLKGTLKETSFKLDTFYGTVDLPVERVVGLINVGEFRPRQLLVTVDGEIFGGKLATENVNLELSSGQLTPIPLSQITRLGYRKRAGEPEEWTFDKPMVLMRTGDRIGVQMPTHPIEVVTRYGRLSLQPASIAGIQLQTDEHGVHEVFLTDGSRFAGLVAQDVFEMKLSDGGDQPVKFPTSSIRQLQLAGKADDPGDEEPTLNLINEDVMVGALNGQLKLDTAFSTLNLNAAEIKRMVHTAGSPSDVQVVLWDDTTVSGQLQEQDVACILKSGVSVRIPVALVQEYTQPRPQPSAAVIASIKTMVADLNAEDWKQRDAAQERLIAMGPAVIATLRELRDQQPPEAQQRIDAIIKQLEQAATKNKAGGGSTSTPLPPPMMID